MILDWYIKLEFEWAKDLPEIYDIFLGIIYFLIGAFIGIIDLFLFPIEILIWLIKRIVISNE